MEWNLWLGTYRRPLIQTISTKCRLVYVKKDNLNFKNYHTLFITTVESIIFWIKICFKEFEHFEIVIILNFRIAAHLSKCVIVCFDNLMHLLEDMHVFLKYLHALWSATICIDFYLIWKKNHAFKAIKFGLHSVCVKCTYRSCRGKILFLNRGIGLIFFIRNCSS